MAIAKPASAPEQWGRELDAATLSRAFRTLGFEDRILVLQLLSEPLSVEALRERLGKGFKDVESNLSALVQAGLARQDPATRAYAVSKSALFALGQEIIRWGVPPDRSADAALPPDATMPVLRVSRATIHSGPHLVLVCGVSVGRAFDLRGPGPWTLGRDPGSHVSLDYDLFASSKHAEIARGGQEFTLTDTLSRNGTFLNWERLARGWRGPLKAGDVVGIGKSLLVFRP